MTSDRVFCDNCASDVHHAGAPLEDMANVDEPDLALEMAPECEDVLVMRGDDPVVTETWCTFCIDGAKRRGVYTHGGRESYGRRYERIGKVNGRDCSATPLRVRRVSEDLK